MKNQSIEEFLIGKTYTVPNSLQPYNMIYSYDEEDKYFKKIRRLSPHTKIGDVFWVNLHQIIYDIKLCKDVSYNNQLYNDLLEFYPEYMI